MHIPASSSSLTFQGLPDRPDPDVQTGTELADIKDTVNLGLQAHRDSTIAQRRTDAAIKAANALYAMENRKDKYIQGLVDQGFDTSLLSTSDSVMSPLLVLQILMENTGPAREKLLKTVQKTGGLCEIGSVKEAKKLPWRLRHFNYKALTVSFSQLEKKFHPAQRADLITLLDDLKEAGLICSLKRKSAYYLTDAAWDLYKETVLKDIEVTRGDNEAFRVRLEGNRWDNIYAQGDRPQITETLIYFMDQRPDFGEKTGLWDEP